MKWRSFHQRSATDLFELQHDLHILVTRRLGLRTMIRRWAGDQEVIARGLGMKQSCVSCGQFTCYCSDGAYLGFLLERIEQRGAVLRWALQQESLEDHIDKIPLDARCKSCLNSLCECDDLAFLGLELSEAERHLLKREPVA